MCGAGVRGGAYPRGEHSSPMKKNVGSYDGAARFVVGCLIMLIGNHTHSWWGLVGLVPIFSTFTEFCFVYAALGVDTTACDKHRAK
jgi:Protein of unknown function (DUF2892).